MAVACLADFLICFCFDSVKLAPQTLYGKECPTFSETTPKWSVFIPRHSIIFIYIYLYINGETRLQIAEGRGRSGRAAGAELCAEARDGAGAGECFARGGGK